MIFEERIRYAKILLSELGDGPFTWSELEKRMIRHCGTHSRFVSLMESLKKNGYILKTEPPKNRAPAS